ncbi:hypothetical protein ACFXJ8_11855 [Nonomuraea sp. NPDC059194]|uniref:hypothetical protein n=1 Tax=Nonomuraea sp. NPDC059194 TaxID=3346764 RepID=UPI0036C50370
MNGLGQPAVQESAAELRARLELVEACEPIWQAHQDAKAAAKEAAVSGDAVAYRAAVEAKNDAAVRLNGTRQWLRREARIAKLKANIPQLQQRLAGQILNEHGQEDAELRAELAERLDGWQAELVELEEVAAPLREALGALPTPVADVVVEDGGASVDVPSPAAMRARVRTGKTGGN